MKRPSPIRKIVFSLIMIFIVVVAADGVAGVATWLFIRPMTISQGLLVHSSVAPHPYRSYMTRPGQTFWDTGTATGNVSGLEMDFGLIPGGVRIDTYGHQVMPADVDLHRTPKPPSEYRILFLGGSTTFQTWPFHIGETLERRRLPKTVKIINAGVGGYTSQENVTDLILSGFCYDPDMVVAYLPVNDIGYAAHWPGFRRDYTHMRVSLETYHTTQAPARHIRPFPFLARLFDTYVYNQKMKEYADQADLTYNTTHQPDPRLQGHIIDPDDFDRTADAVIDNIFTMKTLCEARGVRFLLLTQKMFKIDNPYMSVIHDRTLECTSRIRESPRLRDVHLLDMQVLIRDEWDREDIDRTIAAFPNREIDFHQPLAYDDMHFTPAGLFLFAAIVGDDIALLIE